MINAVTPKRALWVDPLPAYPAASHPRTRVASAHVALAAGAVDAAVAPAMVARQLGEC